MFHEGSLQSGIARAIQEQKLVACFVRDDSVTSSTWEKKWLGSGWLSSLLEQKSVLLKIEAGSTEAGFLAAFCPLNDPPVFVVIHNGQLQERITSEISKEEFINRIRKVLGAEPIPGVALDAAVEMEEAIEQPQQFEEEEEIRDEPIVSAPPPVVEPVSRSGAPEPAQPTASTPPMSEKAKGKQKVASTDPKPSATSTTRNAQQSARDALRKKKQEEKDELARIKARIEADKAERKAQAEARKAEREREKQSQSSDATPSARTITRSTKGSQSKEVHLNVRLFDGRNVRKTFPRTAKLQDDVRPWLDDEFAANAEDPRHRLPPYIFKQILAPLPNKEISTGEEGQELGDIDLAPSATLILIPVKGYTEAYAGGNTGVVGGVVGGVTGLVGGAFGLVSSTVGFVGSTLGSVVGFGGGGSGVSTEEQQQQSQGRTVGGDASSSSASSRTQHNDAANSTSRIKVRTMAEQRAREAKDQQLYNGNQLNFEPRKDDEDMGR